MSKVERNEVGYLPTCHGKRERERENEGLTGPFTKVGLIERSMGCALKFSTASGAGSISTAKKAGILTTLRRDLPAETHVTLKIRLLETIEETVELARDIEMRSFRVWSARPLCCTAAEIYSKLGSDKTSRLASPCLVLLLQMVMFLRYQILNK